MLRCHTRWCQTNRSQVCQTTHQNTGEVESGKVAGNQAPILSSQTNSEAGQISRSDYDMETLTQVIALYSGR